jgi:hypothetical protein
VSEARVSREGLSGQRPGREARVWSGAGKRRNRPDRPAHDHPGDSYYGQQIVKSPTWAELDIAGYLFAGGLAGASSILAAGADLTGRRRLARRSRVAATAAIGVSLGALIHDLGRPERFLNMLRVFKPTSPMSVGVWILTGYAPLAAATALSDLSGRLRLGGRACGLGAAALGAPVATYTAALIANTAVPAWHEGRRELPTLFAGSAAAAAGGFGLLVAPVVENAPARRMAVLGAMGELGAERALERRLGMVSEALHEGVAGRRLRAAKIATAAGAIGAATIARHSRIGAAISGTALLGGSALTRFGLFEAGVASTRDPKYTVGPQRLRRPA